MKSIEELALDDFLDRSEDEALFDMFLKSNNASLSLILTEGFEERSLGILERAGRSDLQVEKVILGRYTTPKDQNCATGDYNRRYRDRFEKAAETLSPGNWEVVENANDGIWVTEALKKAPTKNVLVDITAISQRGFFGALDSCLETDSEVFIGYTEAEEYWPKKTDWQVLREEIQGQKTLADLIDEKPWLFGLDHRVEIIPGHEGYDSASGGRSLVAFLSFKHARLAAVLATEDFSDFLFIAGLPHLPENRWRLAAQKEINEPLIRNRNCIQMDTFSYRKALGQLQKAFFVDDSLFFKSNVHLCILGSKLQTIACWALSCIIPSITVITSTPKEYYAKAFSEGIGTSWFFPFTAPR